jgi:outer membrane protein assembly factor BamB
MMLELSPGGAKKIWTQTILDSKFQGVILEDEMIYGVAENGGGRLTCINWTDGKRKWRADDSAITLHAGGSIVRAAGDRAVLMSEEGMLSLVKISPAGVELVSQFEALPGETQVWSTPLLYGGRIFVKGPKELVCFELPKP